MSILLVDSLERLTRMLILTTLLLPSAPVMLMDQKLGTPFTIATKMRQKVLAIASHQRMKRALLGLEI